MASPRRRLEPKSSELIDEHDAAQPIEQIRKPERTFMAKTWFITGASSGFGRQLTSFCSNAEIASPALQGRRHV